jgi:hypothetical protein
MPHDADAGAPPPHWHSIWQGSDGIWKVLTESELRLFPLEQLAINWAEGRAVTS